MLLFKAVIRAVLWLILLAILPMSVASWSTTAAQTVQPDPILRPFTQFTLDNGLTVLVREDHKLPIASVTVIYNVGSRFDPPGRNGMAHLFEHLLFYGSQHNPRGHLVATQSLGITNTNGGTGIDMTSLIETAPISQLDAVLWLESDRMGYLTLTQKTVTEQIEIVRNEIKMNRDEPGGDVRHYIAAGVFPADHPYHKEAVGDPQELGSITLDEVRNFFKTYYAPSNAAVVIAGDITPSEALGKVKLYFGGLQTGPRPGRISTWIPEFSQDKRERIFDTAPPQLFLNWPMPSFGTIDDVHLRLAGSILMDGASSRVRRRLSAAGLNAADLSWGVNGRAMASLFQVSAKAASTAEFRTIERLIRDEIAALAAKEPTREELERAKRSRLLELRRLTQRTADFNGQSDLLASVWALGDGNAGLLDDNMQQMRAATPADVSAATQRWLHRAAYILDLEPTVQYRPTSADVDRSRIPGATAFKPADFPETHVTTLPNGLQMRHAQWQGGPLVVASLIVRGGAGVDPQDKQGLARLTASLLTAGAGKMGEEQMTDALARLDATLQATTDVDAVTLTLVAPKENIKEALDLLRTVVSAPTFPDAAVEREKKKQIQEVRDVPNTPRLLSRATVRRLLYGAGTPYAAEGSGLGTTSGLSKITRADIAEYHHQWFNPANSEIVIVGDISQAEAEAALTGTLGRWSSAGSRAPVVSVPQQVAAQGVYLIDRPGMEQAYLTAATLLDAPVSPANPTNAVMTNILGDSTAGRIYVDLRDQKQWAYWAWGIVRGGRAGQMLLIETQVQTQHTAEAIAAIRNHIESVKGSKPISPDELQLTKDMLTLGLPLEWETDEGIANAIATSVRRGLPDGAIEKYVTDIRAVTKEQVEQAARQILRPDAMVWLVIGDRSKVEPQLKQAGIAYKVLTPEP
ncbi:MAG TPA: pitrilysin family protein [Pyrinomonadaceae bacterium]|jgi:zinc protease|nr:pitrilysin family protein [Pyrinomonadaceae bacterium]